MPGFVLLVRNREDGNPAMRLGITVTKKIGGAVVRNRMKRRFRALAREVFPESGFKGADHVLIGRADGVERDYGRLREELQRALRKLNSSVRPEPAEGPSFSPVAKKTSRASTGSARTGEGKEP